MTEAEWLSCTKPERMLHHLYGKVSDRKVRLFACACLRRVARFLDHPQSRQALEVAELFADGEADDARRRVTLAAAKTAARWPRRRPFWDAGDMTRDAAGAARDVLQARIQGSVVIEALRRITIAAGAEAFESASAAEGWEGVYQKAERLRAAVPPVQCDLLRDVFGNPFRPAEVSPAWLEWNGGTVRSVARAIYDERAFGRLPVLADALEEAGCTDADLLAHCRSGGPHARGCWVVDALLGKK
jgi:hypothetical protein